MPGADVPVETLSLSCRDGHFALTRLYRGAPAGGKPQPALLYFHGGGYVLGGLDSHDSLCRDLAYEARCCVLAVDYRLAPEHKFPTAFQDAEDAHGQLLDRGAEWGIDIRRLAVGGDSVGGTLATALCIAARDAGRRQPLLQMLLYPCTSARQDTDSHRRLASGHLLEHATLQWMFGHYLRDEADRLDWRFAPLELAGFPQLAVVARGETLGQVLQLCRLLGTIALDRVRIGESAEEEVQVQVLRPAERRIPDRLGLCAEMIRTPPLIGGESFRQRAQRVLRLHVAYPHAQAAPTASRHMRDVVGGAAYVDVAAPPCLQGIGGRQTMAMRR